jgi:hypothetical protein
MKTVVLSAALLAYPCAAFAQHGGGGHIGGSSAGGGGLSGGGRGSGVEIKDDLRDFHQMMAVQASREQKTAYSALLRSTETAIAKLQQFAETVTKGNIPSELATRDKDLGDAIENARLLNKSFLAGFSEAQKSGLKEASRRLVKADSELAQQARILDQQVEVNAAAAQMAASEQSLQRTLANFQHVQLALGDEMSITPLGASQDSAFNLPPVRNIVKVMGQPVAVTTSGVISKGLSKDGQNTFAVELTADLSDAQQTIADILRVQLDKSDPCGERIALQSASLTPDGTAGLVTAQLHYERWSCGMMLGRQGMNEIVEGNAAFQVKLTPVVGEDSTLHLTAQVGRIDAEGLLGQMLRSSEGEQLRDKISDSVLQLLREGGDFNSDLPSRARSFATLTRARFLGTGSGKLIAVLNGEIRVSNENLAALTTDLKERSSSTESTMAKPELVTR